MIINKTYLYSFLFSIYSFTISYILFFYYIEGDQFYYIDFYESISQYSFIEGFVFYNLKLDSQEPIYYIIVFLLNGLVSKQILFSFLNGLFGYCLAFLLLRRRYYPSLLFLLPFNFYLLVLYLSAERLKVSLLFLLIAFIITRKWIKSLLLFASIFTHIQTVLLFFSIQIQKSIPLIKRLFKGVISLRVLGLIGTFLVLLSVLVLIRAHITAKILAYISLGGMTNLIKPLFFMILTLFYSREKKLEAFFMHLPLIFASFFIGDMRIVIFSYFILFYYASKINRGLNLGIIVPSIYFIIKGVLFIISILKYGTGFA